MVDSSPTRLDWIWNKFGQAGALLILPTLIALVLYYFGVSKAIAGAFFLGGVGLVLVRKWAPEQFDYVAQLVMLLFVVPVGILLTFAIHWSLPLILFPLYAILVLAKDTVIGLILVVMILIALVGIKTGSWVTPDSPMGRAFAQQDVAISDLWTKISGAPQVISTAVETSIQRASGTYYEGKTDPNAQRTLGIQVSQVKVDSSSADLPVEISARISADLLGQLNDPFVVDYSCFVDERTPDRYTPSNPSLSFYTKDFSDVSCRYNPGTLSAGTHKLNFSASYAFKTFAYIEGFFVDNDRYVDLQRQGVDVRSKYGIAEEPQAIYTSGPVNIGMGLGTSQPRRIYQDQDSEFFVGITINRANQWAASGSIRKINSFFLILPKEIELVAVRFSKGGSEIVAQSVSCADLPVDDQGACTANSKAYRVDTAGISADAFTSFPVSMRAHVKIPVAQYPSLLGAGGLSSKFIAVSLQYEYGMEIVQAFSITPKVS